MPDHRPIAKTRFKPFLHGRRKRDFRQKDQGLPALGNGMGDGFKINFRFA